MIKINTSGDYVQLIYVDPVTESVQQELRSDTDAFECSYDSEGKLFMQFGAMRFENPDPTDFIIDGVAVTDAADFITKLSALFTGTHTFNGDVGIYTNGDPALATQESFLIANNNGIQIGWQNAGGAEFALSNASDLSQFTIQSTKDIYLQGGNNPTEIHLDDVAQTITHTATKHTFNGVINLPTQAAPASPNDGDIWREDNTNTGLKIRIGGVTKTITVS